MTALAIASSTSTMLTVITPRAALCVGGQLSWLRMPSAETRERPQHERAAADVEQRLGGLGALFGGEGDQRGQHRRAESYRTVGRPSYRDSVAATWPW